MTRLLAVLLLALSFTSNAEPPRRIISIAPSISETVIALDKGNTLVGISTYCPDPGHHPTRVGGYLDPEIETILSLQPDLVMTAPNPSLETALNRFDIPHKVFQQQWTTVENILASITEIGRALGIEEKAAQLTGRIQHQLDTLKALHAESNLATPTVLLVIEKQAGSLIAAGPGSHLDELLTFAGAKNALTTGPPYPNLPIEQVVALDPEVIIEMTADHNRQPSQAGWSSLEGVQAVSQGRVYLEPPGNYVIPGPGIGKAAERLYALIHGTRGQK